ncbi:PTS system transporter subunit IIC [Listeria monocytogenes SHL005]|nr:PTS system transporter subunit IIC [Listeria monocytogenes SHL005]
MSVALRKASAGEEMVGSSYDDEIDEAEWEA